MAKNKLLLIIVCLSMLMYAQVYAFGEVKSSEGNKITIKNNFGLPLISKTIAEYELLSNTEQCLTNCHAVLEVTLYENMNIYDKIDFNLANGNKKNIDFEVVDERYVATEIDVDDYATCDKVKKEKNNQTGKNEDVTYKDRCKTGTHKEIITKKVKTKIDQNSASIGNDTGVKYHIVLSGVKKPSDRLDWVLTAKGLELNEFAWWQSNWIRTFNLTANNSKNFPLRSYEMNITINGLTLIADGMDVNGKDFRVTQNLVEIPYYNFTSFNRADANIVIKVNLPETTNTSNIQIYYKNPSAVFPYYNLSDVYSIYDNFNYEDLDGTNERWESIAHGSWAISKGNASGVGLTGGANKPDILCARNVNLSAGFVAEFLGTTQASGGSAGMYFYFNESGNANDYADNKSYYVFIDRGGAVNMPLLARVGNYSSGFTPIEHQFPDNFSALSVGSSYPYNKFVKFKTEVHKGNFADFLFNTSVDYLNGTIQSITTDATQTLYPINASDRNVRALAGTFCLVDTTNIVINYTNVSVRQAINPYVAQDISYGFGTAYSNTGVTVSTIPSSNNTGFSKSSVSFNITGTPTNANLTNITLKIYKLHPYSAFATNFTNLGLLETAITLNSTYTLTDSTEWYFNASACGLLDDGSPYCSNSPELNFFVDTTPPVLTLNNNTLNLTTTVVPVTTQLNYTASDDHLDTCYYTTDTNPALTTFTCNTSTTFNTATGGNHYIIYSANDTANGTSSSTINYFINYIQPPAVSYSQTVVEGETRIFWLNITANLITQANATLNFGSYAYQLTASSSNSTDIRFEYTDLAQPVDANTNYTFNFSYYVNGMPFLSETYNQTVLNLPNLTDCAVATGRVILNLSLKDEEENLLVNLTSPNTATIEFETLITSKNNPAINVSYSNTWVDNSTVAICIPYGILNTSSYNIDFTIGFSSTDHVQEFYYLDDGTLDNTNNFNAYTSNTINLYDLKSADSTTFLFTYKDFDGLRVPNAIVHTFRKYIGDGLFREVERSKQDNNGQTHVHLVEEDVIYYFMISQYGEIVFTSDTYNAKCLSTPCEITLSGSLEQINWSYDNEGNRYAVTSNKATRTATTKFEINQSDLVRMDLYKIVDGSEVLVNQTSLTAMAGTLNLHVPLAYGNNTFFVAIFRNNTFVKSVWVDMTESGKDYFGTFGAILSGLIILALGLMAITEGAGFIVVTSLALVIVGIMQLVSLSWLAIVSLICAGGVILWKLVSRRGKSQ